MHEYGVSQATVRSALRLLRGEGLIDAGRGKPATVRELPERRRVKLPRNATLRFRMPTPEESRRHRIPEGVPVAEVTLADGSVSLYIGDRDELTT
jgi:Bacterial regulatory proteins, gntR family.